MNQQPDMKAGPKVANMADLVAAKEAKQPAKAKLTKVLPTERIAFPRQMDLLRAYGALGQSGGSVTLKDASNMVKLSMNTATLASSFFVDNGLLQKLDGLRLTPGPDTIAYARAFQWSPETAAQKLEPALSSRWFSTALVPRLRFGNLTEEQAIGVLAEAAAAPPAYKTQLKLVLEFMKATGIVTEEGGNYSLGRSAPAQEERVAPRSQVVEATGTARGSSTAVATSFLQPTDGVVQFHISVKVDMAEFSGWPGDRIAAFFAGIAQVLAAKGNIEKGAADKS